LIAIVDPVYPLTGISIRIGVLNLRPTPEIPNSRAPFEDSQAGSVVTVVATAEIAVLSNVPPEAGVITVEAGIVTRILQDGLKTTFVEPLIVTEVAAVVVPEIVDTEERVPPVTVTETLGEESDPVASAAKDFGAKIESTRNRAVPKKTKFFFIKERLEKWKRSYY
jgi:hypothetical protein